MAELNMNRRAFLKASALGSGGLLLTVALPGCANIGSKGMVSDEQWQASAWLRIDTDNQITFVLDRTEMGQGTYTGLLTLLCEELEVNPARVQVEFAGVDSFYNNPLYKLQITGGSTSVATSFQRIRIAGASARSMLLQAASEVMKTPVGELHCDDGRVLNAAGKGLTYGELATLAAQLSVPTEPKLKAPEQYRYIGKFNPRLDARQKATGQAEYGIDVELPGMLYAVISRAPAYGGTVGKLNADAARAAAGVVDVFTVDAGNRHGVAVVARSYWQARKAQQLLSIDWQAPETAPSSSEVFAQYARDLDNDDGKAVRDEGDFSAASATAASVLNVEYRMPYLAHATLEPQNCVVKADADGMEVWAPTQAPGMARIAAAKHSRYSVDDILVHTTWIGGGFGRRLMQDFVAECAFIADRLQQPVKLIWSREDDTRNDFYRPASLHRLSASLNADGQATGWQHRIAHPKVMHWFVPDAAAAQYPFMPKFMFPMLAGAGKLGEGILAPDDSSGYEGAAELPYALNNIDVRFIASDPGVPVGYWRSVGHSHNGFVTESFIDELAHKAGQDPLAYRLQLLSAHPRAVGVLSKVRDMAWGKPLPGCAQGVAVHKSFGTWVAQIADVEVSGQSLRVKRVVCAVDCGQVVNPDTVVAQMEGGIIFALTAALYGEITLDKGAVQQSNFHDYALARLPETPAIEVAIVDNGDSPTGVGEPGVPPLAAAVGNAVFAASGQRLRALPLKLA
ncbi:molybdopterin cofactor-binding domain-containing protein [Thalassolituus sp. LLYu03]|uniref:xanthine dehydrogenase family protein molybdopterin-binding subunit n=1 Tax=Thalassolituus sp. LLYu03 TaxID=3421656 RepID=UPI003D2A507D